MSEQPRVTSEAELVKVLVERMNSTVATDTPLAWLIDEMLTAAIPYILHLSNYPESIGPVKSYLLAAYPTLEFIKNLTPEGLEHLHSLMVEELERQSA